MTDILATGDAAGTRQCGRDHDHEPHFWNADSLGLPARRAGTGTSYHCPGPIADPEVLALRDAINAGGGLTFNARLTQRALAAVRKAFPEGEFDPDSEDDQVAAGRAMRTDGRTEVGPVNRSVVRRVMRALADDRGCAA